MNQVDDAGKPPKEADEMAFPGESAPAPSESSATRAGSPGDELQIVRAERDALEQKWLLAVADLENYRRRMQKEREQERRFAALPLARDLLPALDNLHRALEAARNGGDVGQLVQGVQMVARQFDDVLAK